MAVGRVAYGEFGVLAVVKRSEANTGAFLDAATDRLTTRAAGHAEFLNVIRAIGRVAAPAQIDKRPALRARLGEFLVWGSDASPGVLVPGPLDRARPIDPEELAEAAAGLLGGPLARADVQDALADVVRRGQRLSGRGLRALKLDPREFASRLLPHLTAGPAEARRAAAGALVAVGVGADDAATRAALESCLRSTDEPLRDLAADALNTPRAHDLARVPAVLRDLRSENPATRSTAARRFQSLGVEPAEVGAALVRATDARDLATREGLCVALERGFATARPAKDVLADLAAAANPDAVTRAYARAALRQLNGP